MQKFMNIAIIGAGFTGLSAAYRLVKNNHQVTIFEKNSLPGGLANGYKEKGWMWSLDKHYHHWFTNDKAILELAKEVDYKVIIKRPKTSVYVNKKIYQFDSPKEILLFPELSLINKLRMGAIVGSLRYNPFWLSLEKINASTFLPKAMGKKSYEMIWEPLFMNKFGKYAGDISLAWFWSRITKRTPSLAYPEGGFLNFAEYLTKIIEQNGGKILFNTEIIKLTNDKKISVQIKNKKNTTNNFDAVIFTLPFNNFIKTAPQLPDSYIQKYRQLNNIGATNLILRLKQPFFKDNTYWLNICDKNAPVMAIVEHTNYMDKKYYNNEYLLYLGNYIATDDPKYKQTKEEKLALFDPYLKQINSDYKKTLIDYKLFKDDFAQPIIPTHYSQMIPPITTPIKNVYLANIQQVYPWDRGTNYAVELGKKAADLVTGH